jgi:G3E family GTPase
MPERTPIYVLTGFLGSGKTTLLRWLLAQPDMSDTAVIVNELGEVGLDHLIVREIAEEVVLLASGCLCCTVRDDLASTIEELHAMQLASASPPFSRIIIETTGLADPAPIVELLIANRTLAECSRLAGLTTTIDSTFGRTQLNEHLEAVKQAALAERLVLTKTDLAHPEEIQTLEQRLRRLNPSARFVHSALGRFPRPDELFHPCSDLGGNAYGRPLREWISEDAVDRMQALTRPSGQHDQRIAHFCVRVEQPVSWALFQEWLELLLTARSESVLRMKGLVHVAGTSRPLLVQCVQHVVYPPVELVTWPDEDRATRLVFITRDLTRTAVITSLEQAGVQRNEA